MTGLTFRAPALVAIPWDSTHRDVLAHDAFRYIQAANRARRPGAEVMARARAIKSGVVPVFGRVGQVAVDGAAQAIVRMAVHVDADGPIPDVGTALGLASGDQGLDRAFGRLQLLGGAEVSHGSLHGSSCGAAMEERVAGGGESPAGGDAPEGRS